MEKKLQDQIQLIRENMGLPGIDDKNGFKVPIAVKEQGNYHIGEQPIPDIDPDKNFTKRLESIDLNINELINDIEKQGEVVPEPLRVYKSAAAMAIADMRGEDTYNTDYDSRNKEVWNHSPSKLISPEVTKLNHDLGVGNYGKDSRSKNYKG